ncbi:MAG: glycoside hydrolase, partial [Candidatus Eisenbacteria bacterium]|nr:glycoside hydrolase [Candidatus Eisenbacteria bacterium]
MSRTPLLPFRLLLTFALLAPLASGARAADRPRTEEERESTADDRVTSALPAGWKLGDAITFPRQLLPVFQTPWRPQIVEPEPEEPTGVLAPFGQLHPKPVLTMLPNTVANDTTGDHAAGTQSENTIVAFGRFVAAGWNDSFDPGGPRSFSGYGYSADGGRTWKDGGILPHGTDDQLLGDPALAVDAKGTFYYAQLYARPGVQLAVAVSRGRFMNDVLTFDKAIVAALPTGQGQLDKEWIAIDKRTGEIYVTYTNFLETGGNQIEMVRSKDEGQTWTMPMVLTDVATESVQGSRPAVGPNGELYVVYTVTDLTDFSDHMRVLKSTDHGRTFGPRVNVGEAPGSKGLSTNFVSGPPGFNRGFGVEFPSIAVNHGGERKGTIYVAWNEAVNWQADPLGGAGVVAELENNNSATTANEITLGQTVTGSYSTTTDLD